jgi:probable phosphomutase (TIGR03848 family)
VALVLVVRHGLTASTGSALTGWTPGVVLDDRGQKQARDLGDRLAGVRLDAIISSPLERCQQTAAAIAEASQGTQLDVQTDDRLGECRYGDWTGKPLKLLAKDPLWRVVQQHPSAVRFPGGESMIEMQQRAVTSVQDWNARLGRDGVYLICSHGDVIKSILADSLGMHLDMCQRIQVDPCSLSLIRYTPLRPFVLRMNDTGADTSVLRRPDPGEPSPPSGGDGDAKIGGGAGG